MQGCHWKRPQLCVCVSRSGGGQMPFVLGSAARAAHVWRETLHTAQFCACMCVCRLHPEGEMVCVGV